MLGRSLRALLANTELPDEILVVDQSRSDETRNLVESMASPLFRYVSSSDKGLSRARNLGIARSRYRVVGFIDDDCIPAGDWIEQTRRTVSDHPRSSIWIGDVHDTEREFFDRLETGTRLIHVEGRTDPWRVGPTGGNSFFRADVFAEIGVFDPRLGQGGEFPGAEDADMVYRVLRSGRRATFHNRIVCLHLEWRDPESEIGKAFNHAIGVGAWLAKCLDEGDLYPLSVIAPRRFLFRPISLPWHYLSRNSFALRRNWSWTRGLWKGFHDWRTRFQ
jgi:GT2 family glycosyltransferase